MSRYQIEDEVDWSDSEIAIDKPATAAPPSSTPQAHPASDAAAPLPATSQWPPESALRASSTTVPPSAAATAPPNVSALYQYMGELTKQRDEAQAEAAVGKHQAAVNAEQAAVNRQGWADCWTARVAVEQQQTARIQQLEHDKQQLRAQVDQLEAELAEWKRSGGLPY